MIFVLAWQLFGVVRVYHGDDNGQGRDEVRYMMENMFFNISRFVFVTVHAYQEPTSAEC